MLLSTTANLSPEKKERISNLLSGKVDWKYLMNLAVLHEIAPLISRNFAANGLNTQVPKPYLDQFDKIYRQTLYKNVILSEELKKVLSALNQRDIPVISLKGIALAELLYGNPALRAISDIDILVPPDHLRQAGSLLIEMGYQQTSPEQRTHPFHGAPYYKQTSIPIFIELHWDLEDNKLLPISGQEIWSRAQALQLESGKTKMLSPEDMVMFSIIQLCKAFDQLKILADITELLKKYEVMLDWRYIVNSVRTWGIGPGGYYSLKWARDLLGAPVPASVIAELKPEAWRRSIIALLSSPGVFISRIKWSKLRAETLILVRGLMMKHARQTILVLNKYRGPGGKSAWLRTTIWIVLVFVAALGSHIARTVSSAE